MSIEDALEFVRNSGADEWDLLIREMNATRKWRNWEAAKNLTVGSMALFEASDPRDNRKGRIINIARGRVILAVPSQESGFMERVNVPASMVRQCS